MATIAEKLTKLADTKKSIKEAIVAKGVAVADTDPFSAYPDKIGQIQTGGGEIVNKTKFGVSIDDLLGDVDENGVYTESTPPVYMNFAKVKEIGSSLIYKFYGLDNIIGVNLGSLRVVGVRTMEYAFQYCYGLKSVIFSSLEHVKSYGMSSAFSGCKIEEHLDLSSLQVVETGGMSNTFTGNKIPSVDLSCLQSVGTNGMNGTFGANYYLTTMSFPSLTSVQNNSFGTSSSNAIFERGSTIIEIHFRADMQTAIEAMSAYSVKFGATNATIYFDLIGTITVNGVAYARDEKQSIRVDGVKTFVGWKDANDNVVYTSYVDNAEPVVGTVVYSDQGTTQVGTVEAVA